MAGESRRTTSWPSPSPLVPSGFPAYCLPSPSSPRPRQWLLVWNTNNSCRNKTRSRISDTCDTNVMFLLTRIIFICLKRMKRRITAQHLMQAKLTARYPACRLSQHRLRSTLQQALAETLCRGSSASKRSDGASLRPRPTNVCWCLDPRLARNARSARRMWLT